MSSKQTVGAPNLINVPTLALSLVIGLWLIKTMYALLVQVQFSVSDVLVTAFVMAAIFGIIAIPMLGLLKCAPINVSRTALSSALVGMGLLTAFAYSPSQQFVRYVSTFPLLQTEMGLGWHNDTAFHLTLIHSILNNGWPSIGQHGVPVTFYHVLSHYVDAAILLITRLDPWDSYGLLYSFKEFMLISALVMVVAFASQRIGYWFFLLSLLFFIPVAIGTWHAIGSHGLWFTSLLNILLIPMVFNILFKNSAPSNKSYIFVFFMGVFLALGKVSTGVGFVGLVLCFLWLKKPKNFQVYILGLFWALFFFSYRSLFTYRIPSDSQGAAIFEDITNRFDTLVSMVTQESLLQKYIILVLLSFVFSIVFYIYTKKIIVAKFSVSIVASASSIFIFSVFGSKLNSSDLYYFIYGLSFQLILLTYLLFSFLWEEGMGGASKMNKFIFIFIFVISTALWPKPQFNFFKTDIKYVAYNFLYGPYAQIASLDVMPKPARIDQVNRLTMNFDRVADRPLSALKLDIERLQKREKLTASNSLLFVPKEVFTDEVADFKGSLWARGLLITAVTGMPLVHGLEELKFSYGYHNYDKNALWLERKKLDSGNACSFGKVIIVVEKLSPSKLTLHRCS